MSNEHPIDQLGGISAVARMARPSWVALTNQDNTAKAMAAAGKTMNDEADMLSIMGTVSDVVAKMSNEDVEYVIYACLAVVRRRQGERFMPVMTGKSFQFQDIDMNAMMRLTVEVLKENLGGFFPMPQGGASTAQG